MNYPISDYFDRFPSQEKVARLLLRYGLRVHDGRAWCGDIEMGDTALGRAAGVDRRVVKAAIQTIEAEEPLRSLFSRLHPTPLFSTAAPVMGWSSIEIIPEDAHSPGILAEVAGVISRAGISIRQALVEDPEMAEEPSLYVITESPVPSELIPRIKECKGVKSILIH
ncbi:MAG: hypothetical protein ACLFUV_04205 [Methanomassiliicoccales archaeon]